MVVVLVVVAVMAGLTGARPQDDEDEYFDLDQEDISQQQPISSYK